MLCKLKLTVIKNQRTWLKNKCWGIAFIDSNKTIWYKRHGVLTCSSVDLKINEVQKWEQKTEIKNKLTFERKKQSIKNLWKQTKRLNNAKYVNDRKKLKKEIDRREIRKINNGRFIRIFKNLEK